MIRISLPIFCLWAKQHFLCSKYLISGAQDCGTYINPYAVSAEKKRGYLFRNPCSLITLARIFGRELQCLYFQSPFTFLFCFKNDTKKNIPSVKNRPIQNVKLNLWPLLYVQYRVWSNMYTRYQHLHTLIPKKRQNLYPQHWDQLYWHFLFPLFIGFYYLRY